MSDIKINGVVYASSDSANITYKDTSVYNKLEELSAGNLSAININYDNTKSGLDATNMQNAVDEVAIMVNGLVVSVTADSWNLSNDGTYKKIIAIEQLTGNETLGVCLYPGDSYTEEQIITFSELITSIETIEGGITLTATEEINVSFRIFLYGKINFDKDHLVALSDSVLEIKSISEEDFEKKSDAEKAAGNYLVDDGEDDEFLSARNIEFDGSEIGIDADNVHDAISELNSNINNKANQSDVDNLSCFSTNEIAVGKWIDGKTIYKKTIQVSSTSKATTISLGTSEVTNIIKWEGVFKGSDGVYESLTWENNNQEYMSYIYDVKINNGNIVANHYKGAKTSNGTVYVTFYYTK